MPDPWESMMDGLAELAGGAERPPRNMTAELQAIRQANEERAAGVEAVRQAEELVPFLVRELAVLRGKLERAEEELAGAHLLAGLLLDRLQEVLNAQ